MSYQKQEFMNHLHNNGYANPGVYCNALDNVEKLFSVDIDAEFKRDQCESLYNNIQVVRKNPERIGKNEHDVRIYASRLNKYIEFMSGQGVEDDFAKKINKLIVEYKKDFNKINEQEIYKWKALKHYQDNWDINAPDFSAMVERAFDKTFNLLGSGQYYPRRMLKELSKENPEKVRSLFKMLYDESIPLESRFDGFRAGFDSLVEERGISHYQDLHAISLYLTFEYPEKYYIYKYGVWTDFLKNINEPIPSIKGEHETFKIENSNKICDDILRVVREDKELCHMSQSRLDDSCYSDPTYRMLAFDIMFYGSYSKIEAYNFGLIYTPLNFYLNTFFTERWEKAKIKWEAVKTFQNNWNIDSDDFIEMFDQSTKTSNFISVSGGVSKRTIMYLAQQDIDNTKKLFEDLYNENQSLESRCDNFYKNLNELAIKHNISINDKNTFVYLFLRFPEKYYVYKSNDMLALKKLVYHNENIRQSGSQTKKMLESYALLDDIKLKIMEQSEFCEKYTDFIRSNGYEDNGFGILVSDFCEIVSDIYGDFNDNTDEWYPSLEEYNPNISKEDWKNYIINVELPDHPAPMQMLKAMMELGGEASCKKLSDIYGGSPYRYVGCTMNLGRRVKKYFNLSPCMDGDQERYFPLPFLGKDGTDGDYIYKLRPELFEALSEMDLSDISPYYDEVNDEAETLEELVELYTKADFLSEVYIPEEKYETCVSRLKHKKNIILQGAPGVGKTFAARRLAWSIMGVKDDNRIEFVQFHQSYSYEDFIMGYKPAGDGFALENGLFYNFCLKAKNDPDNEYFFIIDEINRGNMSKIFGELLMLIENDYRDMEITLAYDKRPFSVPKNLYIIGMMNTADRSLAMIDYALRRRFSFVEMTPGFDSEGFVSYQTNMNNDKFNKLISRVKALNADIENDASLGKGFCIGHSYFCGLKEDCTDAVLKEIVDYDIIPMLEEYWFDDEAKAKNWSNDLRGVFNG